MARKQRAAAHSDSEGEPSDGGAWRRSVTPKETFSDTEGANDDGEWPVEIIGEEVDSEGVVRYETRWPTWKRADGSNVTWINRYLPDDMIEDWEDRRTLTRKSHGVVIPTTVDIHLEETYFRSQDYEAKLAERQVARRTHPHNELPMKFARLMAEKLGPDNEFSVASRGTGVASEQPRRRSRDASHAVASGSTSRRSAKNTPSAQAGPSRSATSSRHRSLASEASSEGGSRISENHSLFSASSRASGQLAPNRRERLERQWNYIAKRSGAGSISIVNDVDDEQVPPLDPHFEYIEAGYVCGPDVSTKCDSGLFVCCECTGGCRHAHTCGCQEPSEIVHNSKRQFAYSSNGRFKFLPPNSIEVIECNSFCSCDLDCLNRVAQRPRPVDIEVFKTGAYGWGVRSPNEVEKGQVLGIYSGLLIRRRDAEALSYEDRGYCFDLDGHEDDDEESNPNNFYTVNGQKHGNWSRFLKYVSTLVVRWQSTCHVYLATHAPQTSACTW
ncbi:hypothetical protein HGRIS_008129 [Hohenbuehelia grisea]|uniref:Pre-SET domain-containing protein n=2 Tax=Hohenbuehelia grisea TaxID=104357 RepID=A0ABR3J722_9AGAR